MPGEKRTDVTEEANIQTASFSEETSKGPPPGFGKGVNDYLNHYVTIADAKAGAILGASITVALSIVAYTPTSPGQVRWRVVSLLLLLSSSLAGVWVMMPRMPRGHPGVVFWEDIRTRKTRSDYARDVSALDGSLVEREYASQNYFVSTVLHAKHFWVRTGFLLLSLALLSSLLTTLG